MITTSRAQVMAALSLVAFIAISAMSRQAHADQNLISLTCAQDKYSIEQYNVWVDVANGLLTYQRIYNGQVSPSSTLSATITSAAISTSVLKIDRTTGKLSFTSYGYGMQELSCHVSNLPLPQPQTKF
jgi:hypothetical protein